MTKYYIIVNKSTMLAVNIMVLRNRSGHWQNRFTDETHWVNIHIKTYLIFTDECLKEISVKEAEKILGFTIIKWELYKINLNDVLYVVNKQSKKIYMWVAYTKQWVKSCFAWSDFERPEDNLKWIPYVDDVREPPLINFPKS